MSFPTNFGIKEVADVRFYNTTDVTYDKSNGTIAIAKGADHVLEFTTLKVSNIEFTAETTEAKGGKGNAALISWDHSREINITLEDALLSLDCMRKMFTKGTGTGAVTVGAGDFPGNYAIVGVTFARDSEGTGDSLFTFFVPNAKISSDFSLTMEADGDPTVFSMSVKALRATKTDDTMIAFIPGDNLTNITLTENENYLDKVVTKTT